jgi:hypothetical protein
MSRSRISRLQMYNVVSYRGRLVFKEGHGTHEAQDNTRTKDLLDRTVLLGGKLDRRTKDPIFALEYIQRTQGNRYHANHIHQGNVFQPSYSAQAPRTWQ